MGPSSKIDTDLRELIGKYDLSTVIAALARYCYRPTTQYYPERKMATAFRRLNSIYEYLIS